MSPIKCPVCGTTNELDPTEIKPCKLCGFSLIHEYNNSAFLPSLRHDILDWSRRQWNELTEKDKQIADLKTELAQLKENLAQTSQAAQQDDSVIEESEAEIARENIDDLWKKFETYVNHVNQEIKNQQDALAENFRKRLNKMRAEIDKDIETRFKEIETRFKEQNPRDLPDQTQRGHDSSSSETSSDTLFSTGQDGMDMNRNTSSSKVTVSSGDSQTHDWSGLYDSSSDDVTVVSPDKVEEIWTNDAPVLLTQDQRGNYWIIKNSSNSCLYLAPKPKMTGNEHNIKSAKKMFDCENYDDSERQEWKLEKPAMVKKIETEDKWGIQEKGRLRFFSKK